MSSKTDIRLTPRRRLARGLAYSTVGPVYVTRGAVGLGAQSVAATVSGVRQRYRSGQLRRELAAAQEAVSRELAAAGDAVASLPQALHEARAARRCGRRPWLLAAAVGAVVLAGGAVAFSVVRRSSRRESSTLPPSVEVDPRL